MCQYIDKINHYLAELGQTMGTRLELDDKHRCFLASDNGADLMIGGSQNSDAFYVISYLCPLPENNREPVMAQALSLNLFQQETRGATIAIDSEIDALVLCFTKAIETTPYQEFINIINNLVGLSEKLSTQLTEFCQLQPATDTPLTSQDPALMMRI